jgi:hypothetical protein
MSQNNVLVDQINKIEEELRSTFITIYSDGSTKYNENTNYNNSNEVPITVNHVHYHSYDVPSYYPMYYPLFTPSYATQAPTIINNYGSNYIPTNSNRDVNKEKEKDKEKDKDKDNTAAQYIALAGVAAASFAFVHYASKDDYIKYKMSSIDKEIEQLITYSKYSNNHNYRIATLIGAYNEWKYKYMERTFKSFAGKTGLFTSSMIGLGGLYMAIPGLQVVGFLSIVGSGCYLYWKHRTDNKKTERELFNKILREINNLYYDISNGMETNNNAPNAPNAPFTKYRYIDMNNQYDNNCDQSIPEFNHNIPIAPLLNNVPIAPPLDTKYYVKPSAPPQYY